MNLLPRLFQVLSSALERHSISAIIEALEKLDGVPVPKKRARPSKQQVEDYFTTLIKTNKRGGKFKI